MGKKLKLKNVEPLSLSDLVFHNELITEKKTQLNHHNHHLENDDEDPKVKVNKNHLKTFDSGANLAR